VAKRPREQIVDTMINFPDTRKENRAVGVPYASEFKDEMRHAGLDTKACARVLTIIIWGFCLRPTVFIPLASFLHPNVQLQ
jgi:hypothetical protein